MAATPAAAGRVPAQAAPSTWAPEAADTVVLEGPARAESREGSGTGVSSNRRHWAAAVATMPNARGAPGEGPFSSWPRTRLRSPAGSRLMAKADGVTKARTRAAAPAAQSGSKRGPWPAMALSAPTGTRAVATTTALVEGALAAGAALVLSVSPSPRRA